MLTETIYRFTGSTGTLGDPYYGYTATYTRKNSHGGGTNTYTKIDNILTRMTYKSSSSRTFIKTLATTDYNNSVVSFSTKDSIYTSGLLAEYLDDLNRGYGAAAGLTNTEFDKIITGTVDMTSQRGGMTPRLNPSNFNGYLLSNQNDYFFTYRLTYQMLFFAQNPRATEIMYSNSTSQIGASSSWDGRYYGEYFTLLINIDKRIAQNITTVNRTLLTLNTTNISYG